MVIRTFWFVVVASSLGLAVAPKLAVRACILFGTAEAILFGTVLAMEQWRGVQVLTTRVLWSQRFYSINVRGEAFPMAQAPKHAKSDAIYFTAARFFYAGRYEDSMALLEARFARVPEAHGALNIACCLTRLRRNHEAVSWLRKADALLPLTRRAMRDPDLRPLRRAGLLAEFEAR